MADTTDTTDVTNEWKITKQEARDRTDELKLRMDEVVILWDRAFEDRIWEPLGYLSWKEWWHEEFGAMEGRLKLTPREQEELAPKMKDAGAKIPEIATVMGVTPRTIDTRIATAKTKAKAKAASRSPATQNFVANDLDNRPKSLETRINDLVSETAPPPAVASEGASNDSGSNIVDLASLDIESSEPELAPQFDPDHEDYDPLAPNPVKPRPLPHERQKRDELIVKLFRQGYTRTQIVNALDVANGTVDTALAQADISNLWHNKPRPVPTEELGVIEWRDEPIPRPAPGARRPLSIPITQIISEVENTEFRVTDFLHHRRRTTVHRRKMILALRKLITVLQVALRHLEEEEATMKNGSGKPTNGNSENGSGHPSPNGIA